MLEKVERFLARNNIASDDIMYIIRDARQTVVTLCSGGQVSCYIPLKYIYDELPVGAFLNITKGVVIGRKHIKSIVGGVYTMNDGREFRGRVRTQGAHSYNSRVHSAGGSMGMLHDTRSMHGHFSILDSCPIPFCAVELVCDSTGRIVDYIFRYVNRAFADFEGKSIEQLSDRSYYSMFSDRDTRWVEYRDKMVEKDGYYELTHTDEQGNVLIRTMNYFIRPGLVGCVVLSAEKE